jgi:hypothetical protein
VRIAEMKNVRILEKLTGLVAMSFTAKILIITTAAI